MFFFKVYFYKNSFQIVLSPPIFNQNSHLLKKKNMKASAQVLMIK